MFALVKDNQIVKLGEIKQLFPDISFPASGPDEVWKRANGVKEIIAGERKDETYFWVQSIEPTYDSSADVVRIGFTSTPKLLNDKEESDKDGNPLYVKVYDPTADGGKGAMVDSSERLVTKGLKSQKIGEVKSIANSLLQSTDWMVIRKAERNINIPSNVTTFREAVITEAERLETAIAATSSVEQLIGVMTTTNWPKL